MKRLRKLCNILLGNAVFALSVAMFVETTGIINGGTTGVGLIVQHYFHIPVSATFAVINVLCFLVGLLVLGKEFAATTLLSTALFPVILAALEKLPQIDMMADDMFLCAVMSGVLSGLGVGLVIREGASTGGLDIPPIIISKMFGISVGSVMMAMNVLLLLLQMFFSNPKQVVYGVIATVLTSVVLDKVLQAGKQGTQILIMSDAYQAIRDQLLTKHMGVTMLSSEGGYGGASRQAVLCAVPSRRLLEVKRLIGEIDPGAFVLVSSVAEVMGKGFTLPR